MTIYTVSALFILVYRLFHFCPFKNACVYETIFSSLPLHCPPRWTCTRDFHLRRGSPTQSPRPCPATLGGLGTAPPPSTQERTLTAPPGRCTFTAFLPGLSEELEAVEEEEGEEEEEEEEG